MASSSVQRSLGIARAIPATAAARNASGPRAPFFSTYLIGDDHRHLDEGAASEAQRYTKSCSSVHLAFQRSRKSSISLLSAATSCQRYGRSHLLSLGPARAYGSAAHAYANDRSRESDGDAVHAPASREATHRSDPPWMPPIGRPPDRTPQQMTMNGEAAPFELGDLPYFTDSRALRTWVNSLDLAQVQQCLESLVLSSNHVTAIVRWARKQSPSSIPPIVHDKILGQVILSRDPALSRQALSYVKDTLRALRKGQQASKVFSEEETRFRNMEILYAMNLEQPDLEGKAADLAVGAPKQLRRSLVWPTLVSYLNHLRTRGEIEAIIEFAISAFPGIPFISNAPNQSDGAAAQISSLIHRAFASLANPLKRLQERHDELSKVNAVAAKRTRWAGILLLRSLLHLDGRQRDALSVFEEIQRAGLQLDEDVTSSLYAWLGSSRMHAQARQVYHALAQAAPLSQTAQRRAASMFASAGESALAEGLLGPAPSSNSAIPSAADFLPRLRALASAGKAEEAETLAQTSLAPGDHDGQQGIAIMPASERGLRRDVLSVLLAARAKIDDIDGALVHLRGILAQNSRPTIVDFNTILQIFARRRDESAAIDLLNHMRAIGVSPDLVTYSTLISLFSSRKEIDKAQEVWQDLVQSGIRPDALAIGSLINAHVESGSWSGVADIYRDLDHEIRQDPAVVNVMLKGLVLLAAPVVEVERIFQEAYPAGRGADARAWALLIQSACEADRFDIALDAYEALTGMASAPNSLVKLTPHIFAILMAGYLRKGDSASAQAVLAEMESRGIARTSVVHGIIVKALADGKWPDKDLTDEQYADHAAAQQSGTGSRRSSRAETIYAPLITASARRSHVQAAEKYFRLIVAAGVQPTLPMYTTLLDAYRRAGDMDGLGKTWNSLYRLVKGSSESDSGKLVVPASQRNLLCIPLSIYMDALSTAGQHDQVAKVWQEVGQVGFSFDAHNWNHLVLALVRAGEIERAFQITEDVLIPRHEEVQQRKIASDRAADIAATSATEETSHNRGEGDFATEPVQRPPNRRHQYRRGGRDDAAAELRGGILNRTETAATDYMAGTAGGADTSISFNLKLFDSWRPADVVWRPSYLTIAVLDRAYNRLERGKAVLALTSSEEDDTLEDSDTVADSDGATIGEGTPASAAQASSPLVLLGRINSRYVKTVGLIMFHRRKKRTERSRRHVE